MNFISVTINFLLRNLEMKKSEFGIEGLGPKEGLGKNEQTREFNTGNYSYIHQGHVQWL